MNISSFLKQQLDKKKQQEKEVSEKESFRKKCLDLLEQIKEINEEKHQELNKIFHQGYDKLNIQRKKIMGLHGQLVNELNILKNNAGIVGSPRQAAKKVIEQVKDSAKLVQKSAEEIGKASKKMANQMVAEISHKPAKKAIKKAAPKSVKKEDSKKAKKSVEKMPSKVKRTKTAAKKTSKK